MDVVANVFSRHGTASGGKLSVALDFLDADGPGSGFHFHRAAHIANGLSARRNGDIHVRVVWHLNGVSDGDVAHARHVFADADGVAPLLDGRIRNSLVQPLLWIVKSKTRGAHIGMHRHGAARTSRNVHVTGGIGELQADGTGHSKSADETSVDGWAGIATRRSQDGRKQHERQAEISVACHSSSGIPQKLALGRFNDSYAKVGTYVPDAALTERGPAVERVSLREPWRYPSRPRATYAKAASFSRQAMAPAISDQSARGFSFGEICTRSSLSWRRTRNWPNSSSGRAASPRSTSATGAGRTSG